MGLVVSCAQEQLKFPVQQTVFSDIRRPRVVAPSTSAIFAPIHFGLYSPASSNRSALAYKTVRVVLPPFVEIASSSLSSSSVSALRSAWVMLGRPMRLLRAF
ncbi:unknown protein [Desulfotalea psychrophila LSv54]|uniref:Uncharacterized protein n=1 Tax=Desulfotalea psychrophila (strain LSv54 / DSM 12343) TaxID=177439 RepID=Q6AKD5_DESPS|nr:unknown protein [Desulfotalea psychrophila LSv54]